MGPASITTHGSATIIIPDRGPGDSIWTIIPGAAGALALTMTTTGSTRALASVSAITAGTEAGEVGMEAGIGAARPPTGPRIVAGMAVASGATRVAATMARTPGSARKRTCTCATTTMYTVTGPES